MAAELSYFHVYIGTRITEVSTLFWSNVYRNFVDGRCGLNIVLKGLRVEVSVQVEYGRNTVAFAGWVSEPNYDVNALHGRPQVFSALTRRMEVLIRQLGSIDYVHLAGCGDGSARVLGAIAKNVFERRHFYIRQIATR